MDLQSELLKSIWYAFTSLEAERSGKVSKSQLKVLSHNLYTALNIPHDPIALEEHFKDNDNGPVSDHGYMPYLNKYILAKATEGTFNKETFDELCWMMTSKKNFKPSIPHGLCSQSDCFKLFCLFNLLSEDRYPLVIIQPELEYLLKKISTAMNQEWDGTALEDLLSKDPSLQDGLTVWMFLEHLSAGHLLRVDSKEAFSLALDDIFLEMYHNVLKKGYMLKKGHVRRNWQERWFVLKPGSLAYYIIEDQKEKKGEVQLDGSCVLETMPDKEGKRCLFCVKTPGRTYEMSATDQKQRVEWIQAMQTALRLKTEGKSSLHKELKLRRRELRENSQNSPRTECPSSQSGLRILSQSSENGQRSLSQSSQSERSTEVEESSSGAHCEPGSKEPDLEIIDIIQQHLEMEVQRKKEDALEKEKQKERQQELERLVEEANKAREDMVALLAKMEREVKQQKVRIQELELTQQKLEEALNTQIQARLEDEKVRHELERLLEEERRKLSDMILNQRQLEARDFAEIDQKMSEHFSKAPHMRQWNVQLNRLMKPITPADKMERLSVRSHHPKHGQALTSTEFIVRYQSTVAETESSNSQFRKTEEDVGTEEPITTSRVEEPPKTREQIEQKKDFA
ncbi:differentially expressed in FDCP 6 homolog isoform X2 [Silurus meridionalis]|uniref:differentially expressed in FDCP 6 homolog isoform X2 n=1 Tax=Silurus meridionalis TaxID=175797 RepID=UPI001EEC697B|nr:differentially expressed in FDCP 6 homolog isoform X2 [Silurus meridionalis]